MHTCYPSVLCCYVEFYIIFRNFTVLLCILNHVCLTIYSIFLLGVIIYSNKYIYIYMFLSNTYISVYYLNCTNHNYIYLHTFFCCLFLKYYIFSQKHECLSCCHDWETFLFSQQNRDHHSAEAAIPTRPREESIHTLPGGLGSSRDRPQPQWCQEWAQPGLFAVC